MPELARQIEAGSGISGNTDLTLRQMLSLRPNSDRLQANLEVALAGLER